jgi:chromosome segregation ATPase
MGRESTISYAQVALAVEKMALEGIRPTSRALRERLGNTGSMGTINRLLQEWKSKRAPEPAASPVLPPALQRVLLEYVNAELASLRAHLGSDLADQEQESADLAAENERLVLSGETQAEAIELLRAEVSKHQGRAGQLQADLDEARDESIRERSGAEVARTELAKTQLRLESMPRLEADLEAARVDFESERGCRVYAEQSAAVMAAKLEAADRRANEADARTTKAETAMALVSAKAESMALDLVTANAALQTGQVRTEGMARDLDAAKQAAVQTALEAKRAGEEAAELRGKLAAIRTDGSPLPKAKR